MPKNQFQRPLPVRHGKEVPRHGKPQAGQPKANAQPAQRAPAPALPPLAALLGRAGR